MKCIECGYTGHMNEFTRISSGISCCSGIHMRRCPKCNTPSPCNPLIEEIYAEKQERDSSELEFEFE